MSVQKWYQLAEEKSAVEQQTQDIHQKFRMNKINKEFGQLSGEELFKPITKRLEKSSTTAQEEEESPDYAMDEFDRTNPSDEEFRPDAPTPAPTPPPSPPPPFQYDDDGGDFPPPPPRQSKKNPHVKSGGCRHRLSLNIPTNQPCCKRSIS